MPEILGTNAPNSAYKPRYKILINDDDWGEWLIQARTEQSGLNRNGNFTLDFDLDLAGEVSPDTGEINNSSSLGVLLTPHTEPFRDLIEIRIGYVDDEADTDNLDLVMDGVLDTVHLSFAKSLVTIRGRDRSALLQESFTHTQFRNQTVADVIKYIAAKHELDVDIVDSGTTVGTVFSSEKIGIENVPSQGYNDWDLLCKFAEYDAYAVFVEGNTLHYRPMEDGDDTIVFEYGHNVEDIEANKNFATATSRVTVELTSVRQKEKDAVTVRAGAQSSSYGKGDAAIFRFTDVPNRDPETLQAVADSLAILLEQHEQIVTVFTTGHSLQSLKNNMKIKGTGSVFDTEYRIIGINWEFGGTEKGWQAEVSGLKLPKGAAIRTHRKNQRRGFTKAR